MFTSASMFTALLLAISAAALPEVAPPTHKPPVIEPARMARWLVAANTWGTIATISNSHDSGSNGTAWANPQSFSDGEPIPCSILQFEFDVLKRLIA